MPFSGLISDLPIFHLWQYSLFRSKENTVTLMSSNSGTVGMSKLSNSPSLITGDDMVARVRPAGGSTLSTVQSRPMWTEVRTKPNPQVLGSVPCEGGPDPYLQVRGPGLSGPDLRVEPGADLVRTSIAEMSPLSHLPHHHNNTTDNGNNSCSCSCHHQRQRQRSQLHLQLPPPMTRTRTRTITAAAAATTNDEDDDHSCTCSSHHHQ